MPSLLPLTYGFCFCLLLLVVYADLFVFDTDVFLHCCVGQLFCVSVHFYNVFVFEPGDPEGCVSVLSEYKISIPRNVQLYWLVWSRFCVCVLGDRCFCAVEYVHRAFVLVAFEVVVCQGQGQSKSRELGVKFGDRFPKVQGCGSP